MLKTIHDLDEYQCRELLFEGSFDFTNNYDNPRFVKVTEINDGSGRWKSYHRLIIKDILEEIYYATDYQQGLTESQDESPFEFTEANWKEVVPVRKIIETIEYKEI